MSSDFAKRAVDAVFERLGVDGLYGAVPCKVLFASDDDEALDFGGRSRPVGRNSAMRVRASEVTPVKGQSFTVGATTYKISSQPTLSDTARLVWSFKVSAS
ncbi:MAG: hypothetical protein K5905_27575 [Roseibium sp.]|uniref:head-tail joining protein n=1 Tax=Roseibium sp. TaxID=1936156 RepID=UPI00260E0CDD|nr:hypothetical protein [Roseibium sp.]MCV0429228.1 hypothetical protein [Roseibium sp.]